MGICAHKKDQEELSFSQLPQFSDNPEDLQLLLDLNKAYQVPLLSLAANPLYLKRIEALRVVDNSSEATSKMHAAEQKEQSAVLSMMGKALI